MASTFNPSVAQRKYVYGIVLAAIPVLAGLGVVLPGGESAVLLLLAAVLGLPTAGLALANTKPGAKDETAAESAPPVQGYPL
ncbi:hypothetical protein CH289_07605 [Rhodococcus sp. RS1C4]|nr:hypothetical protein [Rhodococcus sp. RS1C4]OZC55051.1 hypothetical protein CH289_07605 [Rhodococcus sp. RS1C4]